MPTSLMYPNLIRVSIFLLLAFISDNTNNEAIAQTQKPNIIFILADDLGYKNVSFNGGNLYETPNLDALAQQSMRFTQCYSSPICSPSRTLLLTGKHNFRNYTRWGVLDTAQKTVANMLKDAGYKTGCYGKWQCDGGDLSIRKFGFDQYCVWSPTSTNVGGRFKNPHLFTNNAYLPSSETQNKYGEDIFADSVIKFIDDNKSVPFFIYYPMVLVHAPFQPTPDDADFAAWDKPKLSDTSYYPSMMKYMDKVVGRIIAKVKEAGIEDNTLIVFTGDNGTAVEVIDYKTSNSNVMGGKGLTNESGTHVPLLVNWPGTVSPGMVNNDLISFVDFLPTFAELAGIPVSDYSPLDGVSFAPRLIGNPGTPRTSLFYHYESHPGTNKYDRWAQTAQYKLYDTSYKNSKRLFYDIINDPEEINPLLESQLSPDVLIIKEYLLNVINGYIKQGLPLLGSPELLSVTDSSAIIIDSVLIDGGSTITASGVVWGPEPNPDLTDNYTTENGTMLNFRSFITGINPNTPYYVKTYATNLAGTAYSKEISFTTPPVSPVSDTATDVKNTSFIANWQPVEGISNYEIDVSGSKEFSNASPEVVTEGFEKGITAPANWVFTNGFTSDITKFGKASPSICAVESGKSITTELLPGNAIQLSFWVSAELDKPGTVLVEGYDGVTWRTIEKIGNLLTTPVTKTFNAVSSANWQNNFTRFRFTFNKSEGKIFFDDVNINYTLLTPTYVEGFESKQVSTNMATVTGLKKNTLYYYRVRALNNNGVSVNSNVTQVLTANEQLGTPVCTNADDITYTSFKANWQKLENADSYRLDVSTSHEFLAPGPKIAVQAFNNGTATEENWAFSGDITTDTINFGKASPAISFNSPTDQVTTATYAASAKKLSFYVRTLNGNGARLQVEGYNGQSWETIENIQEIPATGIIKTYDSSSALLNKNFLRFRFTFTGTDSVIFDDVEIHYTTTSNTFVKGYKNFSVNGNSFKIRELENNTTYYYRIRGISTLLDDTSKNSNIIKVTTKQSLKPSLTIRAYPNPSVNEFILRLDATSNDLIALIITDAKGKRMYQTKVKNNETFRFGHNFAPGVYFVRAIQGNIAKTIKVIKSQ